MIIIFIVTDFFIFLFQIGNPLLCTQIADSLLREKGHYIQAINYPTVAKGEEKLRLAPTPKHTRVMIDEFVQDTLEIFNNLNVPKATINSSNVAQAVSVH